VERWPEWGEGCADIGAGLIGPYGDRQQERVIIGQSLEQKHIEEGLDQCLVTEEEYQQGPDAWARFHDPLPPIEIETEEIVQ